MPTIMLGAAKHSRATHTKSQWAQRSPVVWAQAQQSRRDDDTSAPGRHRAPVWNQEFQFLVEEPSTQVCVR